MTRPIRARLALAALSLWLALAPQAGAAVDAEPAPAPAEIKIGAIIESWTGRPELENSTVGIEVMELPSGKILASHNGNKRFIPASTAKVITTACAWDTLGADFRYKTGILAYGKVGRGRIDGDLVIAPSQDPSLDSNDLRQLFAAVRAKGITQAEGKLNQLPVAGGEDRFAPGWLAEDWGQDWMPVSSNLVIDHNTCWGKDPGRGLRAEPVPASSSGNALFQTLLQSDLTAGWVAYDRARNIVSVHRPSGPQMGTAGSLMVANPSDFNSAVAAQIARAQGIKLGSRSRANTAIEPLLLAEHQSKPLKQIIETTLHESDNLYAQQILRTLGLRRPGSREGGVLEDRGLAFMSDWLASIGVTKKEAVLFDGCGLSRKNGLTPHALNMVLKHMAGSDGLSEYVQSLRLEGPSRTTPGSYYFKTGAMDCVRAVSGVVHTAGNGALAVSVIVNGHQPSVRDVRVALNQLISQLRALPAGATTHAGQPAPPLAGSTRVGPASRSHGKGTGIKSVRKKQAKKKKRSRR